eukprot:g12285.t1
MEEGLAAKLLGLAAVAANSAAADRSSTPPGVESEEDEEDRWYRQGSYEEGSEEDEEEDDSVGGKRKRMSADDRKARNRERNRLHARKTRQRKKQHVQELQLKIWGLRQERQRLLQLATDHRTAGVLLALSCSPKQCIQGAGSSGPESSSSSPRLPPALSLPQTAATAAASSSGRDWSQEVASHEDALRKITQEFESMDGGQHAGEEEETGISVGRGRAYSSTSSNGGGGKGGSRGGVKGTLADRTALRRERNRMHAKRTRNRKKLFVEACSVMIDKMKVENAQLEHEIKAAGIDLPQDNWTQEVRESVPEEPLPEYLSALWDFAEGKSHSPKSASTTTTLVTPPATLRASSRGGAVRQSRRASSSSSSSSSWACTTSSSWSSSSSANNRQQRIGGTSTALIASTAVSEEPPRPPSPPPASSTRPAAVLAAAANAVANSSPGQALEDASTLCAFMEAAQTRSVKRARVAPASQELEEDGSNLESAKQQQTQPRGWSDHGSTTSESRGGSEFSEEDSASERKSTDGSGASSSESGGTVLPPAFWTSRQVLERYVLPRQQLLQG